jgi:hypothetical protein
MNTQPVEKPTKQKQDFETTRGEKNGSRNRHVETLTLAATSLGFVVVRLE